MSEQSKTGWITITVPYTARETTLTGEDAGTFTALDGRSGLSVLRAGVEVRIWTSNIHTAVARSWPIGREQADRAKRLAEIETLLASVPEGVWSWEEGRDGRWTLYVDRGEPIDPGWPRGIGNMQHGFNILRGSEETFDANGEALRAFIVTAPTMLRDLLAEHRAASEALTAAGIPDDGRSLAERAKALAGKAAPKRCDDCGGTDAPYGHRFGCGLEPEDPDILAAVERCRRGEHRKAGETMPGSCADCGVDWGDLDAEDEPSTGLGVAVEGDAEPLRTDGPIVRRTAAERADEIDRRWGVDPDAERRLDAFLATTAPPARKRPLRAPMTAALHDLGIVAAHGATPQALAEDVASQVLFVVRAYALADPATLAPDALALRGRIRARLELPPAAEMPTATAERCDVCGRASLLGLDHDYHPEPDIEPAVGDEPGAS